MADLGSLAVGGAIGAGATAAVWGLLRWRSHRRSVAAPGPAATDPTDPAPPSVATEGPLPEPRFELLSRPPVSPAPGARSAPEPSVLPRRPPPAEYVVLSHRVVVHLGTLGRLLPDEVARPERTQQGITDLLSCPQSTLSRVLNRLVASGVLERERRHVRGLDRRVYAYTLTPRGEELARELRSRAVYVTPTARPPVLPESPAASPAPRV
jgi:DNA-binding MarR family transcriptional regulator